MRFAPAPHFAYFKVLNGITSKLLVLKEEKPQGWRGAPSSADAAEAFRLYGTVGDVQRRGAEASQARRDGTTPAAREGRGAALGHGGRPDAS